MSILNPCRASIALSMRGGFARAWPTLIALRQADESSSGQLLAKGYGTWQQPKRTQAA
ncbi:MAG: hypothetical protein WCJ99_12145 [Betaproteobacteria bacterium]